MVRLRVPPAGRMKGMRHRWMRFEPYRPQAYLTYAGGHKAKSAPHRAYSLHATGRTSCPLSLSLISLTVLALNGLVFVAKSDRDCCIITSVTYVLRST